MKTLITVIADYGSLSDLAFAEVTQTLYSLMSPEDIIIDKISVPAFDTVSTGFVLGQLANTSNVKDHIFYVNTAPRKDDLSPRKSNDGEGLVYAELYNEVKILGVNSGHSFSFVKDNIHKLFKFTYPSYGSQFRSRDCFTERLRGVVLGGSMWLGDEEIPTNTIPDTPEAIVCYVDGYGNLKTNLKIPKHMNEVLVTMNGVTNRVQVVEGIFGVRDGSLCIAEGSSGWGSPKERFTEISLRGGSAADLFGVNLAGKKIEIH